MDPRIGNRYMHAGLGFGGGCLPKDIRSFRTQARRWTSRPWMTGWAWWTAINLRQRARTVCWLQELCGGTLPGRTITVLGAAFKPETDDIRDSPALDVAAPARRRRGARHRDGSEGHQPRLDALSAAAVRGLRIDGRWRAPSWCCC